MDWFWIYNPPNLAVLLADNLPPPISAEVAFMDKIVTIVPVYLAGSATGMLVGYLVWLPGRLLALW